jgi:alpha-1,6-mannosyltransferase
VKLCDVTQFYSPFSGGVKRYLHEKISFIQNATTHEHVLIVPGAETKCVEEKRSRVYAIKAPLVSRTGRYRVLLNLRALTKILERESPDLIESSDPYQIGWRAIKTGKAHGIPVIGFYHSHFAEAHVRGAARIFGRRSSETVMEFARRYVRRLYNSFDATLVPSARLGALLREWGVDNVRSVPLGVDTTVFQPEPDDVSATRAQLGIADSSRLLLYVGRLSKEKNTDLLFHAFELLAARVPDQFHLLVIGDGGQRKQLRSLQKRFANITWLRYCTNPAQLAHWYRAADFLVHPGTQETFGLTSLESQACGTPVIGIRGSYMDEVIRHDQSWWAETDTAEAFAGAIASAAERDLQQAGEEAAREVAREFSWPRIFQRLFYIYTETCSKYAQQNGPEGTAPAVHDSPVSTV